MNTLDIHDIMQHLPHRYPFQLLDRILDYEVGKTLTALKNVTNNEPFFQGHFPGRPIMPGVLILEAMAQATGILAFKTAGHVPDGSSLYYFVGIDNARFKQPVIPGDQLIIQVDFVRERRGIWKFDGEARVDDNVVCSAVLMCAERNVE